MTTHGTVVVGVDGSPGSRAALHHALDDAERRHALLRVVAAVEVPEYWAMSYGMVAPLPLPEIVEDVRAEARRTVDAVLAERVGGTDVPIAVEARAGAPGDVLIEAAKGADVLVLGHRGLGTLRSALLGSVGLRCVLHAACPVTVVRTTGRDHSPTLVATAAGAVEEG